MMAANQLGGVIAMIPACSAPEAIEISATDCIQRIDQETAHHGYDGQPQNTEAFMNREKTSNGRPVSS
jgi:hypothetical protein